MIDDVRATQKELETTFNNAQEGIEEMATRLLAKDKSPPGIFSQGQHTLVYKVRKEIDNPNYFSDFCAL